MRAHPFRLLHSMLLGLGRDDHPHYLTTARHSAVNHDGLVINHAGLENVTANQHHTENHASRHDPGGADESTAFLRSALTPTTWANSAAPGARQLNTAFQPSTTRPVEGWYSVQIRLTATTAQAGQIELRSDASNPPTTVRHRMRYQRPASLIGDGTVGSVLSYKIPIGHYVSLATVTDPGSAAITYELHQHTETPL